MPEDGQRSFGRLGGLLFFSPSEEDQDPESRAGGIRRYRGIHAAEYGGIPLRSGVAVRSARPGGYEQAVNNCPTGTRKCKLHVDFCCPTGEIPVKQLVLFVL